MPRLATAEETVSLPLLRQEIVKRYAKQLPLLHIKDGPLVKGQPHTAVGSGKMNIPACINAAPNCLPHPITHILDGPLSKWLRKSVCGLIRLISKA